MANSAPNPATAISSAAASSTSAPNPLVRQNAASGQRSFASAEQLLVSDTIHTANNREKWRRFFSWLGALSLICIMVFGLFIGSDALLGAFFALFCAAQISETFTLGFWLSSQREIDTALASIKYQDPSSSASQPKRHGAKAKLISGNIFFYIIPTLGMASINFMMAMHFVGFSAIEGVIEASYVTSIVLPVLMCVFMLMYTYGMLMNQRSGDLTKSSNVSFALQFIVSSFSGVLFAACKMFTVGGFTLAASAIPIINLIVLVVVAALFVALTYHHLRTLPPEITTNISSASVGSGAALHAAPAQPSPTASLEPSTILVPPPISGYGSTKDFGPKGNIDAPSSLPADSPGGAQHYVSVLIKAEPANFPSSQQQPAPGEQQLLGSLGHHGSESYLEAGNQAIFGSLEAEEEARYRPAAHQSLPDKAARVSTSLYDPDQNAATAAVAASSDAFKTANGKALHYHYSMTFWSQDRCWLPRWDSNAMNESASLLPRHEARSA